MQLLSSAVSSGKELHNKNSPSASPVTVIRIICIRVRVPRVAAATIRGWGLVEEIRYHHHCGICKQEALTENYAHTKHHTGLKQLGFYS